MPNSLALESALLETAHYAETANGLAKLLMSLHEGVTVYKMAATCTEKRDAQAGIVCEAIRLAPVMDALLLYAEMICGRADESLSLLSEWSDGQETT